MGKKTDALTIFVSGMIVGGILGVLYAPDKGSQTREKLSFKLKKYKEKLESLLGELVSGKETASTSSEARIKADQVISATRNKAERLLEDVDSMLNQIRGGSNP